MSKKGDWAWVLAQFGLFALIAVTWVIGPPVSQLGIVPALLGAALALWASRTMGRSLTPFPTPKPDGRLVRDGPFRRLRHPIYVGGILVFGGFSLVFSAWGLPLTGLLAVLWFAKARHEEVLLQERFPDYAEYHRETWF
jgi:protein-S-isoprenylcysteine O-methyltransferase Ste14